VVVMADVVTSPNLTSASERRRNNFKDFQDFYLKAKARIWL